MPAFDYSAYNSAGKLVSGVISADSERQARRLLKEKELLPATLATVTEQHTNNSDKSGNKSGNKSSGRGRREARVNNWDHFDSVRTAPRRSTAHDH